MVDGSSRERSSEGEGGEDTASSSPEEWFGFAQKQRHAKLSSIARAISVKRTLDEAELAVKLASDFGTDPSLLRDIDFVSLSRRLERDLRETNAELAQSQELSAEELDRLAGRQEEALQQLQLLQPEEEVEEQPSADGVVQKTVPKIRRVISRAREIPLTVELPSSLQTDEGGVDIGAAFNESKNVVAAAKEIWQRLNGADVSRDLELISLQKEVKALLALRAEATKLRSGIRLVQRQKELKSAYLIRFGESADLLGETLRADRSIAKLQKEVSKIRRHAS